MKKEIKKLLNIGILTNIPAPYREKMWESYAEIPDVSIDIYYCAKTEADRKWKFKKAQNVNEFFLEGITIREKMHFNPSVCRLAKRYDLWLIGGYAIPTMQLLILLCKFLRIPYVILFDGISPLRILEKENPILFLWKKFLVKGCFAWLGNGTVGHKYGRKLGLPGDKLFNQYLTVDVEHFQKNIERKKEIRHSFRKRHEIDQDLFLFLYVGRLVESKGVQDLLLAFQKVKEKNRYRVGLLIVGHGDYEQYLKNEAKKMQDVFFLGPVDYERIYEVYYSADALVLPSYSDPWGLVVNEALACGIPVIASSAVGAAPDLVDPGLIFEPGDISGIQRGIESLINKETKDYVSGYSASRISEWNFKNAKNSLREIIDRLRTLEHDK